VKHVVVLQRTGERQHGSPGRDHDWHELVAAGEAPSARAAALDAEHPLFILYTSGTTGKPKGVLHTTGGYMVGATLTTKYVFDLRDDDVYWCTADVGWVTGHSYVVYGPLCNGAT
jgi:acetyl-CoA synthetase